MSDCELCTTKHPREFWRNSNFYVIDASDDDLSGFVRVIATKHVKEVSDLPDDVRQELFEILTVIERTMIRCMQPDKVNWASLGNMVAHVHWHIVARYVDDAFFPGSIWSQKLRNTDPAVKQIRDEKATEMIECIKKELDYRFC